MSTDELLAEALRLTRVDRARVAEELLSSLEESDEEVATAWATELERRSREIADGHIQTISWETARTEILKELEQRRASRTRQSSATAGPQRTAMPICRADERSPGASGVLSCPQLSTSNYWQDAAITLPDSTFNAGPAAVAGVDAADVEAG